MIEKIWKQLESPYPCFSQIDELFEGKDLYYKFGDSSAFSTADSDAFWENAATFLLLILCAEGESIV